jgi:hypothetical protein
MATSGGMKIGLKVSSALLDTVFGMKDGSVRQQSQADLGTQLMSSGPLANLLATTAGNVAFFAIKAEMDVATDYTAPQAAWVFADEDPANNGAYYFTNGDPGYWTFMLNFPASWVYATISGGDANAIELSMSATVSASTMIFFEVQDDNLAGGVTVAVNDGLPMDLFDFRGDELEAGALSEGALAVFFPLGDGTARMIIDNTATAAAASAAASAASANASAIASSNSAIDAAASAVQAERFATAPEDEETSVGSGLYSAFHWAQKAMSVVLGALADQIIAATTKTTPDSADVFTFVEDTTSNLKKFTWANLLAAVGIANKLDKDASNIGDATAKLAFLNAVSGLSSAAQTFTEAVAKQIRANLLGGLGPADAIYEEQYGSGTSGGDLTASTWTKRLINTNVHDPDSLLSWASNEFTPAVDGEVEFGAIGYSVNQMMARLYNVTDAAVTKTGESVVASQAGNGSATSKGICRVLGGKTYRLEQWCTATKTVNGKGAPSTSGSVETYAYVRFKRV